ncbi:hypothetical protein HAX54_022275 [Datura stramonium]|uniref:Uncharacterized protein n=1 Tax=Datura stramonium TaxID=4076 RepID=A0ABS8S449_DATST|nr:hypothetical protein [Datura stramonium]
MVFFHNSTPNGSSRAISKLASADVDGLSEENNCSYQSDDDVELTAEKDSAFRRATRWCGGDDVRVPHGPYGLGHTCWLPITMRKQGCRPERIRKDCLSSDCSLRSGT